MKTVYAALALCVLAASDASAQVPASAGARAVERPVAAAAGCQLDAAGGRMAFAQCDPVPSGNRALAREIEIVEYRDGDDPGSASISANGQPLDGWVLRHVSVTDPDDDGDGVPTADAAAARVAGGRLKVGRVTLRRVTGRAANTGWPPADMDSDGFPMVVTLTNPAGGAAHIALAGCTPERAGTRAAIPARGEQPASVTLRCTSVRVEADGAASPYARFVAGAADAAGVAGARPTGDAVLRAQGARAAEGVRLRGAEVVGWSVDADDARRNSLRWTLEVRVDRWEPM